MIAYRIADARHVIFDGKGAMLRGGRWNSIGHPVIYASGSFAGAMLEVLAHANLPVPPKNHRVVRITIPERVKVEAVEPRTLLGWDADDLVASRGYGDGWLREMRTAVLLVPSVITGGRENNVVINPLHAEFGMISAGEPEEIRWDMRLFAGVSGR